MAGQQSGHAHGGDALAGAGFADQSHDFPVLNGQGNPSDRFPITGMKFDVQIVNFQHRNLL